MSIDKIKQLHSNPEILSDFERGFINDNYERFKKYGDKTKFSEKQIALVDKIYQERIVEGNPATKVAGAE